MRVLILGGTAEARAVAEQLCARPGFDVISSLAGRVSNPALPAGQVRVGGFGGVDGLAGYLRTARIAAMIDATHPFAATISANAARAAERSGCPLVMLRRPGWTERPGDRWHRVADLPAAAAAARRSGPGCIFLTTGRGGLPEFRGDAEHDYLVRLVEPALPAELPEKHQLILARGPYTVDGEIALLQRHQVRLLVSKDSGGAMTVAKLDAARSRGLPVLLVDRPPAPAGVQQVSEPAEAISWLDSGAG